MSARNSILRHILLPAIAPALFFFVAAIPVEVLGCRNRGLLAVTVALIGALAALGAATMGAWRRMHSDVYALWWVVSALILAVPAVAVITILSVR